MWCRPAVGASSGKRCARPPLATCAPAPERHVPRSGTAAPVPACRWREGACWRVGRIPPGRRIGAAFGEGAARPPPSSAAAVAGSSPGTPAARPRVLARAGPLFSPAVAAPDDAPPSAVAPPHSAWAAATRCTAVTCARFALQDGHTPRPLHEKATSSSSLQLSQRTRQGTRYRPPPTGPRGAPACLWGAGPTRARGRGGPQPAPDCPLPGPPGPL